MPGHVKLGKSGEPDPDPAPYLVVSMEMKRKKSGTMQNSDSILHLPGSNLPLIF
jgi:hypothetical protein